MTNQYTHGTAYVEHGTHLAVVDRTYGSVRRAQNVDALIVEHHARQTFHAMLTKVAHHTTTSDR